MNIKTRITSRALRSTALCSTLVLPMAIASGAVAQDADQEIEEVIVTGSRIAHDPNLAGTVPVQSVTAEDLKLGGDIDIVEMLNDIPALLSSTTPTGSAFALGGSGTGRSVLQLRGLGDNRTLVLVDGRRHVAGVGGSQAVDVGSIPRQLIERVEVLTGGASAIYGADAVTGVVNFILKDDFEGLQANINGGISGQGDAETLSASAIWGQNFSGGRGNYTIAVEYNTRQGLLAGDRAFSRDNGIGDDLPNPALRFQVGDIDPTATPNFSRFYSPSTAFASTTFPCSRYGINYCYGFHPVGNRINTAQDFVDFWREAFPGDPDPVFTQAELSLFDRAANAPARLIAKKPNFSLTSHSGVLLPGGVFNTGVDLDNNGVDDCQDSFQGAISTYDFSPAGIGLIGGCWIIEPDGSVRPLRDGLIAGDINQFGDDGVPNTFDLDSITPKDTKYSVNFTTNYELTDSMSFFLEAKYVRQKAQSGAPQTAFWDLLTVSPDNPYISQLPAALVAVGQSEGFFITRDPADLIPGLNYTDTNIRETYRFVAGLEGELSNGMNYELSANYGKFTNNVTDRNEVIVDRWFAAIDVISDANGNPICRSDVDPTAPPTTPFGIPAFDSGFFTFNPGDGQCKPANILGGQFAMSPEAQNFFTTTLHDKFELEQLVFSGVVTGDTGGFLNLPEGPIQYAIGAEYRDEKSTSTFDPLTRGICPVTTADCTQGQAVSELGLSQKSLTFDSGALTQNSGGSFDVKEVFAEMSVPLLRNKQFAEELTFDAAARFSDYSTVGSTLTWKVGASWTPVQDIRFRGTYAVAVRAPNINELFSPAQAAFFRPFDPCDQNQIDALTANDPEAGALRAANCLADGIPVNFADPLTARFVGSRSGNPNLQEETAKTFTIGGVLQPSFMDGLTITVDYWDIRIADAIANVPAQDIVDNCYDSLQFPDNQFCAQFDRNTDASSPQFNGFVDLRQTQLNFAALETNGIDFSGRYQFDWQDFAFTASLSGTRVFNLDQFFDPSDPTTVDPELGELFRPRWAGNLNLAVQRGPVSVRWQTQYLGTMALRGVEIDTIDANFGPAGLAGKSYIHDISFRYELDERIQIYGGVNNLADKSPFLTEVAFPVSPFGRYFFIGLDFAL